MPKPKARPQPTANPERGEHELTLEGVTYRLRPSHAAIVAIEKKTGSSLLELVRSGEAGGISSVDLGIVAAELIRAGGEDDATRHVSADRIAEMIYEEGIVTVTARLTACLIDAVLGGRTASGEARAATA